jgi:hypothetical protein
MENLTTFNTATQYINIHITCIQIYSKSYQIGFSISQYIYKIRLLEETITSDIPQKAWLDVTCNQIEPEHR